MTDKQKLQIITNAFEDTIWMAIRYAHSRTTYAPSTVRHAVRQFQTVYPDWKPQPDSTLATFVNDVDSLKIKSDYLTDLFEDQ